MKPLQFKYPLDLHCSQTPSTSCFSPAGLNTLWIYTALKRGDQPYMRYVRLNTLWIYTALKHSHNRLFVFDSLNTLWIYTALKQRMKDLRQLAV